MRCPPQPILLTLAVVAVTASVFAVTPAAVGALGATPDSATATATFKATQEETTTASDEENFSVAVNTPETVAANVTQTYSVDVSGADGNVTATWAFEGEEREGETVQHAFDESGNATIDVTVVDESNETVEKTVVVEVVDYSDEDESNPLEAIGGIVIIGVTIGVVPILLLIYVVPKAMEILTDDL